jgi:aryl-alcohol dehydrogenase-like predicted oxidoreductase
MRATSLPTAELGSTGMAISRVGFGAWAIAGADWYYSWGHQDTDDALATIRHAVESGINWIDTAAMYGLGNAERLVARVLRDLPVADRPYVFTKGGLVWDETDRTRAPRRIGSPASLRRELEDSLRRLEVERIDVYHMHWPAADGTRLDEYWQTLLDFKAEGKVAAVGLSNHEVPELARAEQLGHVDVVQPPFSAIHRGAADGLLGWAREAGTGVVAYSPMASGLLARAFSAERVRAMAADDWRKTTPEFTRDLDTSVAVFRAVSTVAERHGITPAAAAIAWVLAFDGVTGAIVGARRPDQIDGWIDAGSVCLTASDFDVVATAIEQAGAGEGPTRPS